MLTGLLSAELLAYSLSFWLGMYLIARNPAIPRLRLTGLGLIAYALSLAGDLTVTQAPTPASAALIARLELPLIFLPSFFWFGASVYLLPETAPLRIKLSRALDYGLIPVVLFIYLLSMSTNLVFDFSSPSPSLGPLYPIFAVLVLVPMFWALILVGRVFQSTSQKKPVGLLLMATLFFGLSAALLILPFDWLPRGWFFLAVSLDFLVLGMVIAWLDALEEGEALLPDFVRVFVSSAFMVILFGGIVLLATLFGTGLNLPMMTLLLAIISAAILSQTWADPIETLLDRLSFGAIPQLRRARAELRVRANTLPRVNESLKVDALDDNEFSRLTRRALSHMGNLPHLATNPLTRLPVIELRLARRGVRDDTLERAAELKKLLTETIRRLKPEGDENFSSAEAWRYYNALYFPYVVGLKPYSRRAGHEDLDPAAQSALTWFRTYVPERTLYNWQNAAAKLVARDIREQEKFMSNRFEAPVIGVDGRHRNGS